MDFNAKNFGQILKFLRVHDGLSMLSLAQKLGTSASRIKSWESGESVPSVRWVVTLSEVLDVPYEVLLNTDKDQIVHYSDQQWDDIVNGVGPFDEVLKGNLLPPKLSKEDFLEKLMTVSSGLDKQDMLELYALAKVKAEKNS